MHLNIFTIIAGFLFFSSFPILDMKRIIFNVFRQAEINVLSAVYNKQRQRLIQTSTYNLTSIEDVTIYL